MNSAEDAAVPAEDQTSPSDGRSHCVMLLLKIVLTVAGAGLLIFLALFVARQCQEQIRRFFIRPYQGKILSFFRIGAPRPQVKPPIRLEIDYASSPTGLHKPDTPMDVCRIIAQCFPSELSEKDVCQEHVSSLLGRGFDTGYLIEHEFGKPDTVIGFIAALRDTRGKETAVYIYDVCIDEDRRGQGLGSSMMSTFVDEYVSAHPEWPRDAVYLGLSVDLTSPYVIPAMNLYIKQGFVRWMEPCGDPSGDGVAKAVAPPYDMLEKATKNPRAFAKQCYRNHQKSLLGRYIRLPETKHTSLPSHFCMYRKYDQGSLDMLKRFGSTKVRFDAIVNALIAEFDECKKPQETKSTSLSVPE